LNVGGACIFGFQIIPLSGAALPPVLRYFWQHETAQLSVKTTTSAMAVNGKGNIQ
jgi:hypothetical protein